MTSVGFMIFAEGTEGWLGMRRTFPALQPHSFAIEGELENARRFARQEVSLPIDSFMSEATSSIVATLRGVNQGR